MPLSALREAILMSLGALVILYVPIRSSSGAVATCSGGGNQEECVCKVLGLPGGSKGQNITVMLKPACGRAAVCSPRSTGLSKRAGG